MFYIVHQGRERTLQEYTKIKLGLNTTIMYKNKKSFPSLSQELVQNSMFLMFMLKQPYCFLLHHIEIK